MAIWLGNIKKIEIIRIENIKFNAWVNKIKGREKIEYLDNNSYFAVDWRIFVRKKVILDTNCKERLGMANKIGNIPSWI